MADWIYVDNSNVFTEGQRVSAVQQGMALDIWDALNNHILDHSYRMRLGKLYEFVAGSERTDTARAMLFGLRPPNNHAIRTIAERARFEVITHDRNASNHEKKVDTGIVSEMVRDT